MHLVFATSIVPDGTLTTGYEIANAAIVRALRSAGVRVTIMGFKWPGSVPSDPETVVLGSVDVRTDNASATQKAEWVLGALRTGLTFSSIKLRTASHDAVRAALEQIGHVDGYVLNGVQMAGAFEELLTARPYLFVAHNVEYQSARENAEAARSLPKRLLFQREARLLEQLERRLCRNARFVFTLSEEDRQPLGVASEAHSAVLPLVTPATSGGAEKPRTIACDAALIGTWTWAPNRIGLDWFLEEVAPHLPAGFRTRIAGAIPSDLKVELPGVELVGRVPDAGDFVRSAAVIPLCSRAGTGVQLKTIETFELGLPSVATTRSLRGIAYRPANCVVADDPVAFAKAMVETAARRMPAIDGTNFIRSQAASLELGIVRGLSALAGSGKAAAA